MNTIVPFAVVFSCSLPFFNFWRQQYFSNHAYYSVPSANRGRRRKGNYIVARDRENHNFITRKIKVSKETEKIERNK